MTCNSDAAEMSGPGASEVELGLEYGRLDLVRVPADWLRLGAELAESVAMQLGDMVDCVEHIGSTSVVGLVAKPILDLAIGFHANTDRDAVERVLVEASWIYRGDGGDNGGHIYVRERLPLVRVAHAHGVMHGGRQWVRYLQLRDRLRADPAACESYSNVKLRLLAELGGDNIRKVYTERKTTVISQILDRSP